MHNPILTYIKLEPYLQAYWRKVMRLSPDEPLILPKAVDETIFTPYLKQNVVIDKQTGERHYCVRKKGKNANGYFQDATSYCQAAYDYANGRSSIIIDGDKIPTEAECQKLAPFLLPKTIIRPHGVEEKCTRFHELSLKGVALVREHIRSTFYYSLCNHIINTKRRSISLGIPYVKQAAIASFLINQGVDTNDNDQQTYEHVRTETYRFVLKHPELAEVNEQETIARKLNKKQQDRELPSFSV